MISKAMGDLVVTRKFLPAEIVAAYPTVKSFVHRTPLLTSQYFDGLTGRNIYFKCENFQKTGSFKARGAINAVSKLLEKDPTCSGVITHSSGNHGAALAFAAKTLGLSCTVVCPENAPQVKIAAIKNYGADVVKCKPTMGDRIAACNAAIEETGKVLVHPHDDYDIMAGQGTMGIEILEEVPDVDAVVVPVGGGGMITGIATYVKSIKPTCKVFAAEPKGKELAPRLASGKPDWDNSLGFLPTLGDGLRVRGMGVRCFQPAVDQVEKTVFSVTDDEIVSVMKTMYERLKIVVEPSSAVGVAALLQPGFRSLDPTIGKVAVIVCGGNVDLDKLPWIGQQ